MGEIFRAEDDVLGRTVAVKVLAERYARDESLRARFTREALAELGRCDEALPHLDRSQELQGHRKEIDQARKLCKKHGRGKGDEG